jgi:hypothetical protein
VLEPHLEAGAQFGVVSSAVEVDNTGLLQGNRQAFQHFLHAVGKAPGCQLLGSKHRIAAAAIRYAVHLALLNILMNRLDFRQTLNDEGANRPLFRLLHPVEWHVVGVCVEWKSRAQCVVFTLKRPPQQSIALYVEGGLQPVSFCVCLRQEEYHRMILWCVLFRAVRILVFNRNSRQLVALPALPVLAGVHRQMEW